MGFNTGNKTFREIMGNGLRYEVPRYQSDYAWEEDHWQELWEDLEASTAEDGEPHYMGYLVLQRAADHEKSLTVIDGQQRLATLSLLILAALFELRSVDAGGNELEANRQRMDVLQSSYIGVTDAVSLAARNKLALNRNNDAYYKTIARLEEPPSRKIRASERSLWNACQFFQTRIRSACHDGASIARMIDRMAGRLFFTTINVSDELNAYRVFETLNARGVKLSTPDLVKNFVFSEIDHDGLHASDLDALDERWGLIGQQLGELNFTQFVLAEWNRRHPLARKKELFRRIKSEIKSPKAANDYLTRLGKASGLYAAVNDGTDEYWNQDSTKVRSQLQALRLFRITQPHGLLLSALEQYKREDFTKVLGWVYVFSMRFNVICGFPHQRQIALYNEISRLVADGKPRKQVKRRIQDLYPTDDQVRAAFAVKTLPTQQSYKKARYLLARIDEHLSGQPVADEKLSLEHILPKNPTPQWRTAFGDHVDEDADRLGNMALMPANLNRDLDRADYAVKRAELAKTPHPTNAITDDTWNHASVERRQAQLADTACQVWRIDFDGVG